MAAQRGAKCDVNSGNTAWSIAEWLHRMLQNGNPAHFGRKAEGLPISVYIIKVVRIRCEKDNIFFMDTTISYRYFFLMSEMTVLT